MAALYSLSLISFLILGWVLVRRVFSSDSGWILLALAMVAGLALLETTVGIAGRGIPWDTAFLIGGAAALALAILLQARTDGKAPRPRFAFPPTLPNLLLAAFLLGSVFLIGSMALRFSINDEIGMQGHQSVVETILRGNFPPSYISFPDIPYRYHYGFNLISACLGRAFPIPGYLAMDVAAIFLWLAMLGGMAALLEELGIPRKYFLLGLIFLVFAGGWSWFLARHESGGMGERYQAPHWQLMYIRSRFLVSHMVIYFFQHPMSLGLPFLFAALVFFKRWITEGGRAYFLASAFLMGALSLAQVMLFLTALTAFGLVFLLRFGSPETTWEKNLAEGFLFAWIALGLAFALGGFFSFAPGLESQALRFTWPPGYLRNEYWGRRVPIGTGGTLIYYFSAFGWMLLLYPVALWRGLRSREALVRFLVFFSVLGFLVPQFFQYPHTWDIVKWFLAFEIGGRFLILWAYAPWYLSKKWVAAVAWFIVLSGAVTPSRYLWSFAVQDTKTYKMGEIQYTGLPQPSVSPAWGRLFQTMRDCRSCFGSVWATNRSARTISPQTGYTGIHLDRNTVQMGIASGPIEKRKRDLERLERAPDAGLLRELKVTWIVFNCGEYRALPPGTRAWLESLKGQAGVRDYSHPEPGPECYQAYYLGPEFFRAALPGSEAAP